MNTSRRRLILLVPASIVAAHLPGCSGGSSEPTCNDLVGVDVRTRQALQYALVSPDPARRCSACALYVGGEAGCGTCQAFPGPVSPNATCNSFAPRP